MSVSPPPLPTCPTCQTGLDATGACPRCTASEDWNDQIEAIDFVTRRLKDWQQAGLLTDRQLQSLTEHYQRRRDIMSAAVAAQQPFQRDGHYPSRAECWSCNESVPPNASHCHSCGAPIADAGVRSLRYWRYLYNEIQVHEESGWLNLRQAHELASDISERIDALKRKLERGRAPFVIPVEEPVDLPRSDQAEPRQRKRKRDDTLQRSLLEVLLDPQSIQWLLAAGGALIVVGLIIWLMSIGFFENAGLVAVALGLGNAVLVGGGWATVLRTRYQNAGLALTLLACLVMPLNLWFYHTHDLITLENNLWLAGVVCCVVYVASALLLKDSLFVYVLVAGITLTGLLILAQMQRFGEVIAPTTLLVILALICLHAERAFPVMEGPFSRQKFGMAFYWSSLIVIAVGLLLLLGAQIVGWLHEPIFRHFGMRNPPDVATRPFLPWSLALVLAGAYYFIYADLVVRRVGVYIYVAAITLLWAEIQVLVLADPPSFDAIVIVSLALTGLAVNCLWAALKDQHGFLRTVPPLGMLLSIIPVSFGILLHFRATNSMLNDLWRAADGLRFEISWPLTGALFVTALAARVGAYLYRHVHRDVSTFYFFMTAAATLVFVAELTWMIDLKPWEQEVLIVMIVPILYVAAAHWYRGHTPELPLIWAAHASVVVMLFCSIWVALGVTPQVAAVQPIEGDARNLLLALYCLETALFYFAVSVVRRTTWTIYPATVMACGALWQFLRYFHTPEEFYTIGFALPGFVLLVLYRLGMFSRSEAAMTSGQGAAPPTSVIVMPSLERAVFQSANALTTLGFASGALLSLSRLFLREDAANEWVSRVQIVLVLLILLLIINALSVWLVQHQVWRRVYVVLGIINAILLVLIIHKLSTLSPWQRLEILSLVVGVVLLAIAYVGWYRESERNSDVVSMAFVFGGLGVTLPTLIAIIAYRLQHNYTPGLDDLALVVACILLFGSGVLCQVKSSTLIGAAGMGIYLLVILIGLHRHLKEQWIIGIYLTLGGVLLFGTGLFLSIYRDRLMLLPEKIKRREGIFKIFDWR